jgi:hypothetical protein
MQHCYLTSLNYPFFMEFCMVVAIMIFSVAWLTQ